MTVRPLPNPRPDPMDLVVRPERFPALPRGGLFRLARRSFSDFISFAECVEEALARRTYESIGWSDPAEFVRGHLGHAHSEVLRLIEVGNEAAEAFEWWSSHHDYEDDPSVRYLTAVMRLNRRQQRRHLLQLAARGRVTVRQVEAVVRATKLSGEQT